MGPVVGLPEDLILVTSLVAKKYVLNEVRCRRGKSWICETCVDRNLPEI